MGEKTHLSSKRISGGVSAVFFPPADAELRLRAPISNSRTTSGNGVAQDLQSQRLHLLCSLAAGSDLLDRTAFTHALGEGDAIAEAGLRRRSRGEYRPDHLVGDGGPRRHAV